MHSPCFFAAITRSLNLLVPHCNSSFCPSGTCSPSPAGLAGSGCAPQTLHALPDSMRPRRDASAARAHEISILFSCSCSCVSGSWGASTSPSPRGMTFCRLQGQRWLRGMHPDAGDGAHTVGVAPHLDLAMRVFILSTFFCFSFISSGLSGVSGSSSMYLSGMRTLSGVDSWVQS